MKSDLWPPPENYVVSLGEAALRPHPETVTRSQHLVSLLSQALPGIETHRFRQRVFDAIAVDAAAEELGDRAQTYVRRLRRWSRKNFARHMSTRFDLLDLWLRRDSPFVPDAHFIDNQNRVVVCYEVEDTHPLKSDAIVLYGNAWWALEYLHWALYLVAYDPYGNARIVQLPEAAIVAAARLERRAV